MRLVRGLLTKRGCDAFHDQLAPIRALTGLLPTVPRPAWATSLGERLRIDVALSGRKRRG